jgi:hypothetical protein
LTLLLGVVDKSLLLLLLMVVAAVVVTFHCLPTRAEVEREVARRDLAEVASDSASDGTGKHRKTPVVHAMVKVVPVVCCLLRSVACRFHRFVLSRDGRTKEMMMFCTDKVPDS